LGALLRKIAEHTVPLVIVVLLMGGSAVAGGLITGSQIEDGSITGKDIKDGSLTPADFFNYLQVSGGGNGGGSGNPPIKGSGSCRATKSSCGGGEKVIKGEKGAKGAKGLPGQKGDPGLAGAPGAPGAPGVSVVTGLEQVVKVTGPNTDSDKELIVECPHGPVVSGGYVLDPNGPFSVYRDYAVEPNKWLVRANSDTSGASWALTVIANCAT
jgi:hypothetical protein